MINKGQVQDVLTALAEEFLIEIPAEHSGRGDYKLDYFTVVGIFVDAPDEWAERIAGYVNAKALSDAHASIA